MLTGVACGDAADAERRAASRPWSPPRSRACNARPQHPGAADRKLEQLHITNFADYALSAECDVHRRAAPAPAMAVLLRECLDARRMSGGDGNYSGSLPTVGIYLDEQPITTIGGALTSMLRHRARGIAVGSQGTLYGASSEAGTIRIITNAGLQRRLAAMTSA